MSAATPTRIMGVLDSLWGGVLLIGGRDLWVRVAGADPTTLERAAVHVLGVRHMVQGAAQAVWPDRLPWLWTAVDIAHAVTMLAWWRGNPETRRPAAVSAALAGTAATVTAIDWLTGRRSR